MATELRRGTKTNTVPTIANSGSSEETIAFSVSSVGMKISDEKKVSIEIIVVSNTTCIVTIASPHAGIDGRFHPDGKRSPAQQIKKLLNIQLVNLSAFKLGYLLSQ